MREFSLTLDARPTEVTAIAIAFHQGLRRMGRQEDFPGFVKSAANILAPVHWDLGYVEEHYFPIRDIRASADLVAPTMATSMATSPERRSPARAITTAAAVSDTATGPSIVGDHADRRGLPPLAEWDGRGSLNPETRQPF